jgi:hypothetical protein
LGMKPGIHAFQHFTFYPKVLLTLDSPLTWVSSEWSPVLEIPSPATLCVARWGLWRALPRYTFPLGWHFCL